MQRHNNNHELLDFPQWQISGLNALFLSHSIRSFATSLITLFGILYIFNLFKTQYNFLNNNHLLILTLAYYALQKISILLFSYPATSIVTRIGFRYSMLVGNTILAIKLFLLILAQKEMLFLIPSALLAGLYIPLYWLPYHSIFVCDGKTKKLGREISVMNMLGQLCAISAPFIGGVIILQLGFGMLYTIAFALVLIAALPLFFMPHHIHLPLPSIEKIWHGFWQRGFRKSLIAFIAVGAEDQIQGTIWPFFLFFLIGSYETMGALTSIALLATFLILFLVGKLVDKKDRKKLLRIGSIGNSLTWFIKIFTRTIPQLFTIDLLYGTTKILHSIPFSAIFYTKADHKGTIQYLLWREWALYAGRLAVLILLILLVYSGIDWTFGFILAAIASLFTMSITT